MSKRASNTSEDTSNATKETRNTLNNATHGTKETKAITTQTEGKITSTNDLTHRPTTCKKNFKSRTYQKKRKSNKRENNDQQWQRRVSVVTSQKPFAKPKAQQTQAHRSGMRDCSLSHSVGAFMRQPKQIHRPKRWIPIKARIWGKAECA